MAQPYEAVLLIAFGGPTSPEEIRPFLARVTKGIPIPPQRLEEVVHHYEAVGGKSPLNKITFRQAKALQKVLNESGHALPVYIGMRNSGPFFHETLEQMTRDGIEKALDAPRGRPEVARGLFQMRVHVGRSRADDDRDV